MCSFLLYTHKSDIWKPIKLTFFFNKKIGKTLLLWFSCFLFLTSKMVSLLTDFYLETTKAIQTQGILLYLSQIFLPSCSSPISGLLFHLGWIMFVLGITMWFVVSDAGFHLINLSFFLILLADWFGPSTCQIWFCFSPLSFFQFPLTYN